MKNRLLLLIIIGVIGLGCLGYLYVVTLRGIPNEKAEGQAGIEGNVKQICGELDTGVASPEPETRE